MIIQKKLNYGRQIIILSQRSINHFCTKLCVEDKEGALGGQFTPAYENTDASKISNRNMINIGG